jgi:C4-dicarboxylate-specific signal transduction histidine kinase
MTAPPRTGPATAVGAIRAERIDAAEARAENVRLREQLEGLRRRVHKGEQRRRALLHIVDDLDRLNKRLANQRKAMLHILVDYENDRRRLARQTERLDHSRRALLHILQDSHTSNQRLEASRKAMIHIMGDLHETTAEIQRREGELREKQEQLVQSAKLATLGELTTGVAHELNNPLNNIGLFIGNAVDHLVLGRSDPPMILRLLQSSLQQVQKATQIISHLRTFGRAASVSRGPVAVCDVIRRALSLLQEQFRLRQIDVTLDLQAADDVVTGNAIQLEQVFLNLLTNARDAVATSPRRGVHVACVSGAGVLAIALGDTGPGIPDPLMKRIFDPFFTTKEVGEGTGLGLSITYGIIKQHRGTISVANQAGAGALFRIELPLAGAGGPAGVPEWDEPRS